MAVETFAKSLWSALTPAGPTAPPLRGEADADVVVVGAGFLGLSTALHLAESGVRVMLLEADEVGFGASGRNTGFVVPSLKTSLGPSDVADKLGPDFGERLVRLVGESGNVVFDLIERLGIECSAEQNGWMQPAHTAAIARVLERRSAEWRERGRTVEILTAAETARKIGAAGYHGALYDPTGGQINPLAYARGLAQACLARGVALHNRSRVTAIERDGTNWRVVTADGRVKVSRVLLTTNALVGRLWPAMAESIIPVRVHQIATKRLSADIQARIVPDRSPVADTRRHTFAVRWSPDGRLVTGGLIMPGHGPLKRASRFFSKRLAGFFLELGVVEPDYVWSGVIAATTDSLPRFVALAPGLDAAIGCNGRGVALTTSLGREIAALYSGRIGAEAFTLPHEPPKPVPGRRLAAIGPHLWLPWSEWRDRREARS